MKYSEIDNHYTEVAPSIQTSSNFEKYPNYKSLKDDINRQPTGAKVVLIHPGVTIEGGEGKEKLYGDLTSAGSTQPPQGICSLAAVLHENGYKVELIDADPLSLSANETAELAMKKNPKYIGISSYTVGIKVSRTIAKTIKEIAKKRSQKVFTILGGPHMTFLPNFAIKRYTEFDFGLRGEGEISIVELIDAIEHDTPLNSIPNLVFRENQVVIQNKKRGPLQDMDELPIPSWDLLPNLTKYYHPAADNIYRLPSVTIITSRGCPGKCVFCNPRGLGASFRRHSATYIIRMMTYLHDQFGIKDVFIVDDMCLYDRQNILDLCALLKENRKNLDLTWSVFGRVDFIDKELIKEMKAARCWQIGLGLESGSSKILKLINKGQTIKQMEKAVKLCNEVGIVVRGMFMVGNFGETKETLQESIDFIKRNDIKDFHVTSFTPMPGTGSFKMWKKYGNWDIDNPDEGSTHSQHLTTFVPFGLTKNEITYYQKLFYRSFLNPRTISYQLTKLFRHSNTIFIIKGGIAFIKYLLLSTFKTNILQDPPLHPEKDSKRGLYA